LLHQKRIIYFLKEMLTGEARLGQSRTKEAADHAGLSLQMESTRLLTKSSKENLSISLNKN